jgi:hypothetical protein
VAGFLLIDISVGITGCDPAQRDDGHRLALKMY